MSGAGGPHRDTGAGASGTAHWWAQRITSVALVPLVIWVAFSVAILGSVDHGALTSWVARPVNTVVLVTVIVAAYYHAALGLQVVIEDYVHVEWMQVGGIIAVRLAAVILAVTGCVSVLRIALGGI